jgi:hypothetical protein
MAREEYSFEPQQESPPFIPGPWPPAPGPHPDPIPYPRRLAGDDPTPDTPEPAETPAAALPAETPAPDPSSFAPTIPGRVPAAARPGLPGVLEDLGIDPAASGRVAAGLEAPLKKKIAEETTMDKLQTWRMEQDRAQLQRAIAAESAAANAVPPPWNADVERARRIQGPLEMFGSIGSVFAMAASAFTRTPMTSALNAGAAAMTAVRQNDEKGYEAAFQAWQDNTTLALKRFGMEHQMVGDIDHLLETDLKTWTAKRQAIAAQFDDQKALLMLQNGMVPELIELDAKKVQMAQGALKAAEGFREYDIKKDLWASDPRANGTPMEKLDLLRDINDPNGSRSVEMQLLRDFKNDTYKRTGHWPDPKESRDFLESYRQSGRAGGAGADREFIDQWRAANPMPENPDELDEWQKKFAEDYGAFKRGQKAGPGQKPLTKTQEEAKAIQDLTAENMAKGMPAAAARLDAIKQLAAAAAKPGSGEKGPITADRQIQQDVLKFGKRLEDTIDSETGKSAFTEDQIANAMEERRKELRILGSPETANKRGTYASLINRNDEVVSAINEIEQSLIDKKAMTGLGGKATRPIEVVKNWFGNDDTARAMFKDRINLVRLLTPRLLNESVAGRPLNAEEEKINSVVPGLELGSTTQNTMDALNSLRSILRTQRESLAKRWRGTWTPENSPGAAAAGVPGATPAPGTLAPVPAVPGSPYSQPPGTAPGGGDPNWFKNVPGYTPGGKRSSLDQQYAALGGAEELPFEPTARKTDYPTSADVARSAQYGQAYGDPVAPYVERPGSAYIKRSPRDYIPAADKEYQRTRKFEPPFHRELTTPETSGMVHKAWLAAERSPIAKLGFDPSKTYSSPKQPGSLTVAGVTFPSADRMWYDEQFPDTAVHESFHRGFKLLRDAGVLPKLQFPEEYYVRALMLRHLGGVERGRGELGEEQIDFAVKVIDPEELDKIEQAAADYIAKKRPRGPH